VVTSAYVNHNRDFIGMNFPRDAQGGDACY
jgi:hypothetical protein